MSPFAWLRRRRKSVVSTGIVTSAALVLGVVAFTYEGFTTADVDLNDGGVWVTNVDSGQLGHLNVQVQALDSELTAPSSEFDVLQDGSDVLLTSVAEGAVSVIDPSAVTVGTVASVPAASVVSLERGMVSILDPVTGNLWAVPVADLGGFSEEESEPLAELGADAVAVLGTDGTLHAASVEDGTILTWNIDGDEYPEEPTSIARHAEVRDATRLQLTAVGERAVAYEPESGTLVLPSGAVSVAENAALQHPSDDAGTVVLASSSHLIEVPMGGGEATATEVGPEVGSPVAPMQVGGCVYAAFEGAQTMMRECDNASESYTEVSRDMDGSGTVFRENYGVVVLNQFRQGNSWLMTDQVVLVNNWADFIPPQSDEPSDEQDESTEDLLQNQPPPQTEENNPPVAVDDTEFGARPGRATILPVLANDSDPDGDILTARVIGDLPEGVRVSAVRNESHLQIELPVNFSAATVRFEYEVSDGRGETDSATVLVQVRGDTENNPPRPLPDLDQRFQIEQRATYEHQVLQGWFDPDGDNLYLADAVSESGDTVQFNAGGRVVYTATGEVGITNLAVEVSDGRERADGNVTVDVRERGSTNPIANADFVSVVEGASASVQPLLNDFVPGGATPRLAAATASSAGITIDVDRGNGTIRIVGGAQGVHFVTYTLAAGPAAAFGVVRVDVVPADEDARPIAVPDVMLLPSGREALVDLIANDVDPTGGVLVVQSIETAGAPITATLVGRQTLRVSDTRGLSEPLTLNYLVSNGRHSETGQVTIIPVPPPERPRPPVSVDDTAVVREGDYVTIDVLENDFSPDGVPINVNPELVASSFESEDEGVAFFFGNKLRVHVLEGGPSTVRLDYEVVDDLGQTSTSQVTVEVRPRDPSDNDRPTAKDVTARVLAGNPVRIPIPLDGIDRDGDGVELVGNDTAPEQGRIVAVGASYFDYEAFTGDAGSTTFEYRVRDRWGLESTATVTIGIAKPGAVNQPPFAETDLVTVRPGRLVAVNVLANDSDPDADQLTLTDALLDEAADEFGEIELTEQSTLQFAAPEAEGDYTFRYQIADARGMRSTGTVVVTVDENAEPVAPVAQDDVVPLADAVLEEPLDVPVLLNDTDRDGSPDELTVSVVTGPGRVVPDGVQVVPSEEFQVVTYRVTDPDGLSAEAFIYVPAVVEQRPFVALAEPLVVGSGQLLEIELRDVVTVPSGGSPRITTNDTVTATNANGDPLVVNETRLNYTSLPSYVGEASISFEVTDGAGPNDEGANTALLTVPITVLPSSEVPPVLAGGVVQVEPGEGSTDFNLAAATTDPDPGDIEQMRYEHIGGSSQLIDVRVEDQVFRASADVQTPPGTQASFRIRATDPAGNEAESTVVVDVVPSKRPLTIARPDAAEGVQGQAVTIPVLANDVNPFADRGDPLTVVAATVVGGDAAQPTTDGSQVTVVPGANFAGVLTLQYRVQDATQTESRTVTGTITINVKGRPSPPVRPNVQAIGDAQVTLSWVQPAANGAPITGYRVIPSNGGPPTECQATTCTATGLTNDVTYTFTVVAINEVGDSDPSPPTIGARPDVRPDQPAPPTTTRGDTQVSVAWVPPANRGSAITRYIVEVSPPVGGRTQFEAPGGSTTLTVPGLTNGTEYTFRVQAHNNADEPSDFSNYSSGVVPAGKPFPATNVTAAQTAGVGATTQVRVNWVQGNANGDPITEHIVTATGGAGAVELSVGGTATSAVFENLPVSEQGYVFTVVARNTVGASDTASSAPLRAVNAPAAATVTHVSDNNGSSTVSVRPGATNGARASEVQYFYTLNGGGRQSLPGVNSNVTIPAGNSDSGYSMVVTAVSTVDGVQYQSPPSNAVRLRPYGPPGAPSVTAKAEVGQVTFNWSPPNPNGRAITHMNWTVSHNGNARQVGAGAGSETFRAPAGTEVCLTMTATDSAGQTSATARACATSRNNPSFRLERGPRTGSVDGCNNFCSYYRLAWENAQPGNYSYTCYHTASGGFRSGTISIGSQSGSAVYQNGTNSGQHGNHLCFHGDTGQAWMTISGPDVSNGETPRINWSS